MVGAVVTLIFIAQQGDGLESISKYYTNAYELTGGKNIVNAILGDFRALDTMFEGIVLIIAGLGIYTLLHYKDRRAKMKENDVVLRTVTKIVVFILLTFGFYVFFAGHNNPGGGFIGGLIFSSAFILMFLAFDVHEVLESLPIDFKKLMIVGAIISKTYCNRSGFFGKSFLYQSEAYIHFPLLGELHVTTITLFELGILLTVVGVIVTIMLALSGGKS